MEVRLEGVPGFHPGAESHTPDAHIFPRRARWG